MNLLIISTFVLLITLMLQNYNGGTFFDVITPLLVSVGLVASRTTTLIWLFLMAFFWSATTRCSFLMLVILWGSSLWILGILSREIQWKKPIIIFFITAGVSFAWQFAALALMWVNNIKPTIDSVAFLSIIFRPITGGIIAALFWSAFLKFVNPHHHLLRED